MDFLKNILDRVKGDRDMPEANTEVFEQMKMAFKDEDII